MPSSAVRWLNMQHWLLQYAFLVISVDDEYGEAGEDDHETKDMGVHDMDAINELLIQPTLSSMLRTEDEMT